MPSDPTILAFDTSAAHCAAALLSSGRIAVQRSEEMGRGQAERLMPLLQEVMDSAGVKWADLSRIGVGVGPGNFTGIRISVAAARGLALSLGVPAIGVSTFDAIRHRVPRARAAVPAPRDQVYLDDSTGPRLVPLAQAGQVDMPPAPADLAAAIAGVAAIAPADSPAPAPLYIRAADAAPARDAPPVILDDA
ncbi:tRNA (adenosine(37)-N6)-threonylcarbamoyltransferase complex dimerization subunit type 1 TsaB [Lutimaribacter sp. EGI FJ00015]|uniref:tRNA (Adenosine(37)-N6)-threonylcarbamoyltransferase complex dimerization subunit type 1 TsaB n=1 Tax=Lutimaribacter degradans TaxID=2945989 RepID=A0ACC5ZYS0_9RHOB|nr:tRNA (adenosine(37)-N6)-threonylcarbamoyltransferase complex dimerization subunit type 1 TsaB [Lutimaribacter sp. EGI FJ00013]MCM2563497.1 tRNA (adenosine(37)-N6)-threonylcarbamoyltransferase complex dimerization subunit type 1 TsaB [Lutimaribacter sp. EGI FJ00013]MCO0614677.1 tRNA (adenosine(37)-N6)-threonylcarbamoyltransferase complex dimerization subunit type 1 TsaB [Lutimaribacter sp. EGI FJ00015]MCO0637347.1 tRNA (adenosine(37)-N6)-threonylcarbamoyltransferase complex dimerization subuni